MFLTVFTFLHKETRPTWCNLVCSRHFRRARSTCRFHRVIDDNQYNVNSERATPCREQLSTRTGQVSLQRIRHTWTAAAAAHVLMAPSPPQTRYINDTFSLHSLYGNCDGQALSLANSVDHWRHFCLLRDSRDGGALVTLYNYGAVYKLFLLLLLLLLLLLYYYYYHYYVQNYTV